MPRFKMTKNQKSLIKSDTSFFLSNNTKTCTISRIIKGIQHLACDLGTEFAMFCTFLLSAVRQCNFQRLLFLQEVTVLLMKFKKSSINAVKMILKYLH